MCASIHSVLCVVFRMLRSFADVRGSTPGAALARVPCMQRAQCANLRSGARVCVCVAFGMLRSFPDSSPD